MATKAVFAGYDASGHLDLWVTDGTAAGTSDLTAALPSLFDQGISPNLGVLAGKVLFDAFPNLWVTDGTAAGTKQLTFEPQSALFYDVIDPDFTALGTKSIFDAYGSNGLDTLYVTDGTSAGTSELFVAGTGSFGGFQSDTPPDFTVLGSNALFSGYDASGHYNLWITNGTVAGTRELTVVGAPASGLFDPSNSPNFTILGHEAVFEGLGAQNIFGLWVTDGTSAGTSELTVAGAASNGLLANGSDPDFTVLGSRALFAGFGSSGSGPSLWVTNGTSAGTSELTVSGSYRTGLFAPAVSTNANIVDVTPDLAVLGSKALFAGYDASGHFNLWVTDGTSAGTSEIAVVGGFSGGIFNQSTASTTKPFFPDFTVIGSKAVFEGEDAAGHLGLWVTDGTSAGTSELSIAGAFVGGLFGGSSVAPDFAASGGKALFNGLDTTGAADLWVTNGTAAGTSELKVAGADSSGLSPSDITFIPPPPAPPAPSGLALAAASDSGVKGDDITNVTKPVITGKGVAGDTVTLRDGTKAIGTTVVAAAGTWSVTPAAALAAGVHSLSATETGASGTSAASPALKLTIETSAPAPSGLSFAVAADKAAKGDTFTVAGKGEAGDTVTLFDGKTAIGTAKVAATGLWSLTTANPLATGTTATPSAIGAHVLSASEVDVAGNKSAVSMAQGLTVERATPNAVIFLGTAGIDHFTGGGGNDIFYFSAANLANSDIVKGGAGVNELQMTTAGTVLAGGVSGVEIYQLANGAANSLTLLTANFAGTSGNTITVDGGANGNTLSEAGVAAADKAILRGGAGADILKAGQNATMTGGAGADVFWFTTPGSAKTPDTNTITDFTHASDKIALSNAGFALGLAGANATPKALPSTMFTTNATGTFGNATERFAYDTANGGFYYDAHGNTAGSSRELVATLANHPTLAATDLFYVS